MTGLIVPEFLESIATEVGIADGVLDVLVPEVVLDRTGVLTVVGQLEAGGMPEHVGMDREVETGHFPGTGHDLPKTGVRQRPLPLRDEDVGRFRILPGQLPQSADLRAAKRMGAGRAVLGVDPTVLSSAATWPNSLKANAFRPASGGRDFLQNTHFVKSCRAAASKMRALGGFRDLSRPAKCQKWLGPPRNGG